MRFTPEEIEAQDAQLLAIYLQIEAGNISEEDGYELGAIVLLGEDNTKTCTD